MIDISNPYVISSLIALIAVLIGYALLIPRNTDNFSPELLADTDRKTLGLRAATRVGNEFYATLPKSINFKKTNKDKIEQILINSGNPWRMTADEFYFFQYVCAFIGFIISFPIHLLIHNTVTIPWYVTALSCTVFGFMIPRLKYNDQAKKRDLDFKRQLPDALALINVSLSSGVTFPQALREAIPNMKDGVLKEELKEVNRQMDTGKTMSEALNYFSKRSPNENIRTFINAVREAGELNVPMQEVLEKRAEASRAEFFALLHEKTAALDSKIMTVLTPTIFAALILIIVAPAIFSLKNTLG